MRQQERQICYSQSKAFSVRKRMRRQASQCVVPAEICMGVARQSLKIGSCHACQPLCGKIRLYPALAKPVLINTAKRSPCDTAHADSLLRNSLGEHTLKVSFVERSAIASRYQLG